jgi:hypothetical protein
VGVLPIVDLGLAVAFVFMSCIRSSGDGKRNGVALNEMPFDTMCTTYLSSMACARETICTKLAAVTGWHTWCSHAFSQFTYAGLDDQGLSVGS